MRTFFLSAFAMIALFGIPRLVNEYRGVRLEAKAPPAIEAKAAPASEKAQRQPAAKPLSSPVTAVAPQMAITPAPVDKPAAAQLVPVALKPAEVAPLPVSQGPALPKTEADLIASIQGELHRLNLYDGPNNGRWNKYVRYAVRKYGRRQGRYIRDPKPTFELLTSLQAAGPIKAEVKLEPLAHADTKPVRQAELRPAEPPVKGAAPAQESAPDDDYLPPWMKRNASGAPVEASPAPVSAAPTQIVAAPTQIRKVTRRHKHRRRSWDWDSGW